MTRTPPPPPITACLLHADYHQMGVACWDATTDWYFAHTTGSAKEQRDAYQAAVERRILDGLRQAQAAGKVPRP